MDFIIDNIFRNPPILLGLIAALGLVLLRKPIGEVVKGSLLAAFGMYILTTGTGLLVSAIAPINNLFSGIVEGEGAEILSDTFTATYGGDIGLAMLTGLSCIC